MGLRHTSGVVALAVIALTLTVGSASPVVARSYYQVLSLATADDFPTAYVIDLDGTFYRLDAQAPRMSLSVPAVTDSRIVVRSLPSCAVVGSMDAAGGSYYQLEFGHDGFHRIRQRGGWDASLIMPPTTHACDSLPATATISPDLNQSGSSDVPRVAGLVAVFCVSLLMFGRRRRLGLLPRGR